jgi:uncharacterized protein YdeI (YjbR/CyaY-like superfamily)
MLGKCCYLSVRDISMRKKFKAPLKKLDDAGSANLGWRVVDVPFDVKKTFGKGGRLPVKGEVNGFAFRTSLFPRKDGKHFLLMNKKMQQSSGATSLGDKVEVSIELDEETRAVDIPLLLKKEIEEDGDLLAYYKSFSYSMRKYFADHITSAKSKQIQKKRAEELAVILMHMRDGEQNPPPILEAEFARNPKAKKGWERMSASHRRSHLWGIFYYKNPDSRARRMAKAIDQMVEYANKQK